MFVDFLKGFSIFGEKSPPGRIQELIEIIEGHADLDAQFNIYLPKRKGGMINFNCVECLLYAFHHLAHKKALQLKDTSGLRVCNNILSMTQPLHVKSPSFIGDNKINPSWKELAKATLTVNSWAKRTGGPSNGLGVSSPANKIARGGGGMPNQLVTRALEGLSRGRGSGKGRGFGGCGRGRSYC